MNNVQKIIKEICDEEKIEFDLVSKDWIMVLKKNDKINYISGYKFDLNSQASSIICDDKYALYDVMRKYNISVVEHYIVFKNYNKLKLINYCNKFNFNIVVKSNTGTCGNDMYHVENKEDLFYRVDKLLEKNYSISLSPYYNIKFEYRAIVLDGKVELIYGKKKPTVIGDGIHSIYDLLCDFNPHYFCKIDNNAVLNKILKKDEKYEYNWQFNLSKGSIPFYLEDDNLKITIKNMALRVMNLLNLRFASVDIIQLKDGTFLLLEVNSGVMMENYSILMKDGYKTAKRIYKKAIDKMFE